LGISDDRKMGKMIVISFLEKLLACENIPCTIFLGFLALEFCKLFP
jgi:hypothetical protein